MDYFAEIANSQDAHEAVQRLREDPDAPGHLLKPPLEGLFWKVPTIWRSELTNWFYYHPPYAARVWQELRFCRVNRERVARAAITLLELRPATAAFARTTAAERREQIAKGVLSSYLRALLVQSVLNSYQYVDVLNQGREPAIRALAQRLKPEHPYQRPCDETHAFMLELDAAAGVPLEPPSFIARLLAELPAKDSILPEDLIADRPLVIRLAKERHVPVPFAIVHDEELQQIEETRDVTGRTGEYSQTTVEPPACHCPPGTPVNEIPNKSAMRKGLAMNLVGLAFSGGGIRSATFNLGVLQGLAKLDILRHCDYLSTVSGGGYIGSWFSAWMHRQGERIETSSEPETNPAKATVEEMRRGLAPNRSPNPLAPRIRPIRYLREFSNYLTPKAGFFSADTWTMAAIYIRNLVLNLLVLLPILAAALLVPRLIFAGTVTLLGPRATYWVPSIGFVLFCVAATALLCNLRRASLPRSAIERDQRQQRAAATDEPVPRYARQGWIQALVVVPLLLIAWLTASCYWLALQKQHPFPLGGHQLSYWCDGWSLPGIARILPETPRGDALLAVIAAVVFTAVGYSLLKYLGSVWLRPWEFLIAIPISAVLSGAVAWLTVESIENVLNLVKSPSLWRASIADFPRAFGSLLTVALVTWLAILAYTRRKPLRRLPLHWIPASLWSSALAVSLAGLLYLLGVFLRSLEPKGKVANLLTSMWPADTSTAISLSAAVVLIIFLLVFWSTRGFSACWPRPWRAVGSMAIALLGSGAAAFGVFLGLGKLLKSGSFSGEDGFWHTLAFGTPLTLASFALVVVIQLGLLGINFPDEHREWWGRLRAWTLIYSVGWTGLFLLAIYPPVWLWNLNQATASKGGWGAVLLWLLSTVAGVKTGSLAASAEKKSRENAAPAAPAHKEMPEAKEAPMSATVLRVVATVAPYIFMLGLLAFISLVLYWSLPGDYTGTYWEQLTKYPNGSLWMLAVALVMISVIVSLRIGVNEFSMHHFYKNRLVRCYLGASRWEERKADWFTGFDSADDIRLRKFDRECANPGEHKFAGPYPLVNAALNLVAGEDLAWQERKASSFTFSPKYCGYDVDRAVMRADKGPYWPDAYVPSSSYMYEKLGPMLGTAMAISGAAANPNMGRVTTAASAFLMTVFNVRLGWWLPNPRKKGRLTASSPRLGIIYGAAELFGLTDDKKDFVNVSDGGHFENLGVYELIRRGCRYIIACDAGQDGSFGLEDLGNVIRKCRTDFGVEIDIAVDRIRERDSRGWSVAHCVVGTIRYPGVAKHCQHGRILVEDELPVSEDGLLIYLKPSITGDEPYDILEYYKRVPEFPHETTADQWFNESQFESYRRLGLHIAVSAFQRYREREDAPLYPPHLFERLRRFWFPPSPKVGEYSTEHTLEYSRIMELVRGSEDLRFLDATLFENIIPRNGRRRDEFYICNALIQLIENVYADLDLEQNYNHPHVGGWMKVFQYWAQQPAFQRTWEQSGPTYAERFRGFYNDRLVSAATRYGEES